MIPCNILDYDDIIEPDDLIRNVYPLGYYCSYSDDSGESTIRWHYAKFRMPAWIGRTIREYRTTAEKNGSKYISEMMIVRVSKDLTLDDLKKLGMPIHMPSASLRKLHFENLGENKFGNLDHSPKEVRVTFGKYKGMTVEEIYNTDRDYLKWLQDNMGGNGKIKNAIDDWLSNSNMML